MLKVLTLVGGARVLATGTQAVTLLLMARALAPARFAEFAAVLGGLMALSIVADGGATYAVGRHHPSSATVTRILRAGRVLSVGTLAVSVPVLGSIAYVSGPSVFAACLPLCLWVPLERQLEVSGAYLLARGRDRAVGAVYLLRRVPTFVAVLTAPSGVDPVFAFAVTLAGSAAVGYLVLARRVAAEIAATGGTAGVAGAAGVAAADIEGGRFPRSLIPPASTWSMLRPYWAAIGGQGVRQVDVAVLTLAAGTAVSGIFAPASRLVPALLLVPGTYTQILLGRLAATNERLTPRLLATVTAVSALAFLPLAATAGVWIPILLGDAYAPSVSVVRIVIVSLVFATLSSAFAAGLHATDRAFWVATAVWSGAGATILSIAALGSVYGALGAAWATAFGYFLQLVLMAVFYRSAPQPRVLLTAGRKV